MNDDEVLLTDFPHESQDHRAKWVGCYSSTAGAVLSAKVPYRGQKRVPQTENKGTIAFSADGRGYDIPTRGFNMFGIAKSNRATHVNSVTAVIDIRH